MIHLTVDGKFQTGAEAVSNVMSQQISKLIPYNGRFPVCVKMQLGKNRMSYGVQFWTRDQISFGTITKLDGSKAILGKRPTKDIVDETYNVHTELVALLKECRDLLVLCTLLDKSGQCHNLVNKIDIRFNW